MTKLPSKVVAVYWTRWNSGIRLTQVPQAYNVLYLFAAPGRPGEPGTIEWGMNEVAPDIKTCRARSQRIVLSAGGAGQGINFSSREISQRFVNSVVRINTELGGTLTNPALDGVDFNTFEAGASPNTAEYLWMFAELKRQFGQDFGITSPPAPWKNEDKAMIREALSKNLMTYAGPQFYDGPGLADPTYIINTTRDWVNNVAGGDASKIVVGFGMENLPNYSTIDQIVVTWQAVEKEFPAIRGAFLWQHKTDSDRAWVFANRVAPLILDNAPVEPPVVPPIVPPQRMAKIGTATYAFTGTDVPRGANELVAYTDKAAITPTNQYGVEVIVQSNKITTVNDRQVSGSTTGTPIPKGSYVLSGHGTARDWLLANGKVGATVEGVVVITEPPIQPPGTGLPVLKKGSTNTAANKTLRGLLTARRADGSFDGVFGTATETDVKAFQKSVSLPETGEVDEATWKKLLGL
jgi:peptidoglycan hydrolase-like protein with peptidoglycan-binding domain